MSATAILVPVLEPEAEALLGAGDTHQASIDLSARAALLRGRTARIDEIREQLHGLLFDQWAEAKQRPGAFIWGLLDRFRKKKEPATVPTGYDPFVHLFGRSWPVVAPNSAQVAKRIAMLLETDDSAFELAIAEDLGRLSPQARAAYESAPACAPPDELDRVLASEIFEIDRALGATPADSLQALDSVVRLSAYSWPVWRLDGEMLGPMLRLLGIRLEIDTARELFEPLLEERPQLAPTLDKLPLALRDHAGAGLWLDSGQVKLVAGSLRLNRMRLADNAQTNADEPLIGLRHLRLLEEAFFFCEQEGLAISEASGVEWHERE